MFKPLMYNIFEGVSWMDGRHVEGLSQAYLERFGNPSITHTRTNAGPNRHIRDGTADFNVRVQWVILRFTSAIDVPNKTVQINHITVPYRDRWTQSSNDSGLHEEATYAQEKEEEPRSSGALYPIGGSLICDTQQEDDQTVVDDVKFDFEWEGEEDDYEGEEDDYEGEEDDYEGEGENVV
ncbi:hypothetical protein B484DRAFT_390608 [Ochromonadaceae sp. CCMP2298]|nr:hypothetical protein B484DRAFT_390608 [Ochromonadaceae sp. CCMP2298]